MNITLTVCFIFIGIIGFLQVADDLGVWMRIDRLHKRGMCDGKRKQF